MANLLDLRQAVVKVWGRRRRGIDGDCKNGVYQATFVSWKTRPHAGKADCQPCDTRPGLARSLAPWLVLVVFAGKLLDPARPITI